MLASNLTQHLAGHRTAVAVAVAGGGGKPKPARRAGEA
jgi:hypothetical protein